MKEMNIIMKFIIPQNYDFKNKLLGVIEYSTAILNLIWYLITFGILNLIFNDWNIIIFLLISLCFPITLFSLVGLNGEPFAYVLRYFIKYLFRPKVYLYKKFNFFQ